MSHDVWVAIAVGIAASIPAMIGAYALGRWDERRREGRERRAITTALCIEIAANLAELEAVWGEIHRPVTQQEPQVARHPQVDLRPAVRLARRSPPRWRRGVWDENLPRITAALDDEDVILVERFYQKLAQLENRLSGIGQPWPTLEHNLNLDTNAVQAWTDFEALAQELRKDGNPLSTCDY